MVERIVEKFNGILADMKRSQGDVALFALMKMDELTDKWTVVLSSPWAQEGDEVVFKYVFELIKKTLLPEELSTIARIAIYSQTDHLIELLLKFNSGASIMNEKINGNQVHEGYIIEANQNPASPRHQEKLV